MLRTALLVTMLAGLMLAACSPKEDESSPGLGRVSESYVLEVLETNPPPSGHRAIVVNLQEETAEGFGDDSTDRQHEIFLIYIPERLASGREGGDFLIFDEDEYVDNFELPGMFIDDSSRDWIYVELLRRTSDTVRGLGDWQPTDYSKFPEGSYDVIRNEEVSVGSMRGTVSEYKMVGDPSEKFSEFLHAVPLAHYGIDAFLEDDNYYLRFLYGSRSDDPPGQVVKLDFSAVMEIVRSITPLNSGAE